ncbi:MAG: dihydrofolate reductase [Opitutales bacterium]|nr:dihydrofolate reductase [Opitutales bacterium]
MSSPDAHPPARPWKAIAAMAHNRVIGCRGKLPWKLPGDLKWVRQCTLGQTVAMGRKTYESIGRPLPGRLNIVLSRSLKELDGCVVLPGVDALADYQTERDIWIFGGGEIYREALPCVSELFLTMVHAEPEGDAFFPPFEDDFELAEVIASHPTHEIRRYVRRTPPSGRGS